MNGKEEISGVLNLLSYDKAASTNKADVLDFGTINHVSD